MTEQVFKRLDAASGNGANFNFKDNKTVIAKFVITGTAGSNIKIFEARDQRTNLSPLFIAQCDDWDGASAELHLKTSHEDNNNFTATGVVFDEKTTTLSSEIR